jgi:hypothetical protein
MPIANARPHPQTRVPALRRIVTRAAEPLAQVGDEHRLHRAEIRAVHRADAGGVGPRVHLAIERIDDARERGCAAETIQRRRRREANERNGRACS